MAVLKFVPDNLIAQLWPSYTQEQRDTVNIGISNLIHQYCNTQFQSVDYLDEIHDNKSNLVLDHMPVISVSKLESKVDGEWTELIEDTDYFVYSDKIVIESPTNYRKSLRVSYSAGIIEIPQMLYEVASELANYKLFKEGEGAFLFYKSQTFEERGYQSDRDMTEVKILSKLSKYIQRSARRASGRGGLRVGVM